jgi:indoleamine 2,3-dioxygenase
MEYALSYDLYNWKRKNPKDALYLDNLQCHRNVTGGIDENNFIIVHTAMEAYSGKVVENTEIAIQSAKENHRDIFNKAIGELADTFEIIL